MSIAAAFSSEVASKYLRCSKIKSFISSISSSKSKSLPSIARTSTFSCNAESISATFSSVSEISSNFSCNSSKELSDANISIFVLIPSNASSNFSWNSVIAVSDAITSILLLINSKFSFTLSLNEFIELSAINISIFSDNIFNACSIVLLSAIESIFSPIVDNASFKEESLAITSTFEVNEFITSFKSAPRSWAFNSISVKESKISSVSELSTNASNFWFNSALLSIRVFADSDKLFCSSNTASNFIDNSSFRLSIFSYVLVLFKSKSRWDLSSSI